MRDNQPVFDDEYVLPDDEVIITHTDVRGCIMYANPGFLRSSGFTLDECMGQPQNIVRHPDMPEAAFADLWRTIRSGKPWTGMVKNRRKNGGFYWVRANVSPMLENGQITGYMSVRVKAQPQEIRKAASIYAEMRSGRAKHLCLSGGMLVDRSALGRFKSLFQLPLGTGTWLFLGTLILLFGVNLAVLASGAPFAGAGRNWLLTANLLGVVMALANLWYVNQQVVAPLQRLAAASLKLVAGDTGARFVVGGDPQIRGLSQVLQQVAAKVTGVVRDAEHAANELLGNAARIVKANADLAQRSNEHAAGLEETAASLEQLTATVQRNTQHATEANTLADDASNVTTRGCEVVSDVVRSMDSIGESSKRISEIVSLIDEIAFQTNLLALNAAVEAARAGEQGRGFAVVAGEVRTLAQRSATAAREIRDLISDSQGVVMMGAELAAQAERTMQEVVKAVRGVTQIMVDIGSASVEQSKGIDQINAAVVHMDQITQSDAAMAQEVSDIADQLNRRALMVSSAISAFSGEQKSSPAAHSDTRSGGVSDVAALSPRNVQAKSETNQWLLTG